MVENVILLVKGFTPNRGNNTHYIFKNINAFIDMFGQSNVIRLSPNDYRIEQGRIIVKAIDGFYDEITYMALLSYDDEQDLYYEHDARFFVVNGVTPLVGYYVYEVSLDLWATYGYKAEIENFRLFQTNKNVNNVTSLHGYYKPVEASLGEPLVENLDVTHPVMYTNELVCVVLIDREIYWDLTGASVSASQLIGVKLSDLFTAWNNPTILSNLGIITCLSCILGSLYKTTFGVDFRVMPRKAWLLPADMVTLSTYTLDNITSKGSGGLTSTDASFNNLFRIVELGEALKMFQFDSSAYLRNKVYAGVKYNGILLNLKTYDQATLTYRFAVKQTAVEVTICDGDNQLDISSNFELSITSNAQVGTATEAMAKAISFLPRILKTGLDLYSGNVAGVAGDVAGSVATIAGGVVHSAPSGQISTGDASVTYGGNVDPTYLETPYKITFYYSIKRDERNYAYLYGALYDGMLENASLPCGLYDKFISYETASHFGYPTQGTRDETYIKGEVTLNGINEEAKTFIENEFARGIFVEAVDNA